MSTHDADVSAQKLRPILDSFRVLLESGLPLNQLPTMMMQAQDHFLNAADDESLGEYYYLLNRAYDRFPENAPEDHGEDDIPPVTELPQPPPPQGPAPVTEVANSSVAPDSASVQEPVDSLDLDAEFDPDLDEGLNPQVGYAVYDTPRSTGMVPDGNTFDWPEIRTAYYARTIDPAACVRANAAEMNKSTPPAPDADKPSGAARETSGKPSESDSSEEPRSPVTSAQTSAAPPSSTSANEASPLPSAPAPVAGPPTKSDPPGEQAKADDASDLGITETATPALAGVQWPTPRSFAAPVPYDELHSRRKRCTEWSFDWPIYLQQKGIPLRDLDPALANCIAEDLMMDCSTYGRESETAAELLEVRGRARTAMRLGDYDHAAPMWDQIMHGAYDQEIDELYTEAIVAKKLLKDVSSRGDIPWLDHQTMFLNSFDERSWQYPARDFTVRINQYQGLRLSSLEWMQVLSDAVMILKNAGYIEQAVFAALLLQLETIWKNEIGPAIGIGLDLLGDLGDVLSQKQTDALIVRTYLGMCFADQEVPRTDFEATFARWADDDCELALWHQLAAETVAAGSDPTAARSHVMDAARTFFETGSHRFLAQWAPRLCQSLAHKEFHQIALDLLEYCLPVAERVSPIETLAEYQSMRSSLQSS